MPTGLAVPVGVGANGGAMLTDGSDNDYKIMALGLGDDSNDNAFQQDIGLGTDMIFDPMEPGVRARITQRLHELFRKWELEKRFKLRSNTIKWEEDSEKQELILSFKYVELESDDEKMFRRSFSRA